MCWIVYKVLVLWMQGWTWARLRWWSCDQHPNKWVKSCYEDPRRQARSPRHQVIKAPTKTQWSAKKNKLPPQWHQRMQVRRTCNQSSGTHRKALVVNWCQASESASRREELRPWWGTWERMELWCFPERIQRPSGSHRNPPVALEKGCPTVNRSNSQILMACLHTSPTMAFMTCST